MLKVVDLVQFTGTVTGEGDVTIVAATTGHRTPAQAGLIDGDQFHYKIATDDGLTWEIGIGGLYEVTGTWYMERFWALGSTGGANVVFPAGTYTVTAVASSMALPAVGNHGAKATANVDGGFAAGDGAAAAGLHSTAVGHLASAAGDFSQAVGEHASAAAPHSIALGRYTKVAGCAALARGSRDYPDYSGTLLWAGYASGALFATDAGGSGFKLPNVRCTALLHILISGGVAATLSDTYAASVLVAVKRAAPDAIMQLDGSPVVTVVKDDAGAAAPEIIVVGTGASSELSIKIGVTSYHWNAHITASVVEVGT